MGARHICETLTGLGYHEAIVGEGGHMLDQYAHWIDGEFGSGDTIKVAHWMGICASDFVTSITSLSISAN